MVLPIAINDTIYIIEGIHKLTTVGKKSTGRSYEINRNIGTVDKFRYETFIKTKITKCFNLFQDYQATYEV